jgi:hypothetical protein
MLSCHHLDVRTTLTLDKDVAAKLKAEVRRSGRTFKEVINEALRLGLNNRTAVPVGRFVVRARPMGSRPGLSYDRVSELVEQVEGPYHG